MMDIFHEGWTEDHHLLKIIAQLTVTVKTDEFSNELYIFLGTYAAYHTTHQIFVRF